MYIKCVFEFTIEMCVHNIAVGQIPDAVLNTIFVYNSTPETGTCH